MAKPVELDLEFSSDPGMSSTELGLTQQAVAYQGGPSAHQEGGQFYARRQDSKAGLKRQSSFESAGGGTSSGRAAERAQEAIGRWFKKKFGNLASEGPNLKHPCYSIALQVRTERQTSIETSFNNNNDDNNLIPSPPILMPSSRSFLIPF